MRCLDLDAYGSPSADVFYFVHQRDEIWFPTRRNNATSLVLNDWKRYNYQVHRLVGTDGTVYQRFDTLNKTFYRNPLSQEEVHVLYNYNRDEFFEIRSKSKALIVDDKYNQINPKNYDSDLKILHLTKGSGILSEVYGSDMVPDIVEEDGWDYLILTNHDQPIEFFNFKKQESIVASPPKIDLQYPHLSTIGAGDYLCWRLGIQFLFYQEEIFSKACLDKLLQTCSKQILSNDQLIASAIENVKRGNY